MPKILPIKIHLVIAYKIAKYFTSSLQHRMEAPTLTKMYIDKLFWMLTRGVDLLMVYATTMHF